MLDKTYQPADIEARVSKLWDDTQAFRAGRPERRDATPYCIVIPPPNVTGSLHMGHALNNTIQDVLCRYWRMQGRDVLWQPGTDHAGIATQMVVERKLAAENKTDRRTMGRDAFLAEVWRWKGESGGTIVNQLKRLGASCDWSRERFTMDEGLSRAVLEVFVTLYEQGLIYKDKRLVNWDPKFQTAISDLEVVQKEINGSLWHFRYPLKGATFDPEDPATYIVVATTRPETMLGDTAIAVHPTEGPYRHLIGRTVVLPLVGREIPIVADDYADPGKGSGAVKITPAHDFNDFEVGKRHADKLEPPINIFDAFAKINDNAPEAYRGLDRFVARKKVVEDLERIGCLAKIEKHKHMVPHGDRSDVPIEPWLTDQWYVNAAELAKPALAAVREGKTRFVPDRFANDYHRWLENIQPWCISRQLWWGHQIPAWYGPDNQVFVARDEARAHEKAAKHYGRPVDLTRDPDVLDTWFSSALWPFSTLGWPDETPELARYYPTTALVTGFDIIFFWVARMMMMGTHFMKEVPFADVYIHGLVRDDKGQKMSKSKGNVMDPLDLIEEFGADALRFSMAAMASQGSDVKFSKSRVEGYRNFATKLWNAVRFAEMNGCARVEHFDPAEVKLSINRWIVGDVGRAAKTVTLAIEDYRFNEAAAAIYEFVWGHYCDWYLELAKPILAGQDETAKAETRACAAWVLDEIITLLHPFMPFITEELWAKTGEQGPARKAPLVLSAWPEATVAADPQADADIGWLIGVVSEIRSVRTEMNVPASAKIPLVVTSKGDADRFSRHGDTIQRLARIETISFAEATPPGSALIVAGETTAALPLAGIIDMDAEKKRLAKAIAADEGDIAKMDAKLGNADFMARAKPEAIEEAQARKAELTERIARLSAALKRLG